MAAQRQVDWERIEPDWRLGIKSVLQLAAEYEAETGRPVSHTAINKHFKKLGVPRDLSAKVRAKADSMVSTAMVSGKVSVETTVADAKLIESDAVIMASVILNHRQDIQRSRKLTMGLLGELEAQTNNLPLFEQLGELMAKPDDKGQDKRNDLYQKVISMPGRVDSMKKIAESLKTLIGLEREAFSIDDHRSEDKPASISISF